MRWVKKGKEYRVVVEHDAPADTRELREAFAAWCRGELAKYTGRGRCMGGQRREVQVVVQ